VIHQIITSISSDAVLLVADFDLYLDSKPDILQLPYTSFTFLMVPQTVLKVGSQNYSCPYIFSDLKTQLLPVILSLFLLTLVKGF
jgi:hypothetical protein